MSETESEPPEGATTLPTPPEDRAAVLHELARLHRQHGNSYALEGIRILVYLNGGALAGIPIATQAFDALEIPFPALVLSSAFFAAGLLAVALVCLFAYFAEDTLGLAYDNQGFGFADDAWSEIRQHPWFRWAAIGCAILSWALFIVAVSVLFLAAQQKITISFEEALRELKGPPTVTPAAPSSP